MLWISEILAETISQHKNSVVVAPYRPNPQITRPLMEDAERYLGPLAMEFCRAQGISFQPIPIPEAPHSRHGERFYSRFAKDSVFKVGGYLHRSYLRRLGRKRPLLSLTHIYRMDHLVRQTQGQDDELPWAVMGETGKPLQGTALVRQATRLIAPRGHEANSQPYMGEAWLRVLERTTGEDKTFTAEMSGALERLAKSVEEETKLFSHRGVAFGTHFASKIRTGIAPAMKTLHREIRAYDELLSLIRPRMVVTPFGRRSVHALGDLSRRRGIPGLLISHGSFTPTDDELSSAAWGFHADGLLHGSFSHAALQSPLAEAYAKELDSSAKFIRTGPLVWGGVAKRDGIEVLQKKLLEGNENSQVLLHAGTVKSRSSIHFYVYETLDEYIANICDLVNAVNEVPNIFLIIKAKSDPLSKEELRSLLPPSDRISISVEEPFLEVLGLADMLVSMASTTIEEALQNQVPVLLYGGEGRYHHISAREVTPDTQVEAGPVFAVRRRNHLADAIQRIFAANGKAPLPAEMFQEYVYKPEEITTFPELVRNLVEA